MTIDFDSTVDSAFHQLYDHHLGWLDEWLDDAAEEIATNRGDGADWLPWGITKAALIVAAAEKLLEEQVMLARSDGSSWRDIGTCMGVNASSAHRWAARRNIDERAEAEAQRRRDWATSRR